jgi:dynein intermediate chain 2
VSVNSKAQAHTEGGWAENIDFTDETTVQKWIKRKTKQPEYPEAVKALADQAEKCIKANNIIDIFEEYFEGETSEHHVEKLNTKTLCLLK